MTLADRYDAHVRWLKVKNRAYTQAEGRGDLFNGPPTAMAMNSYSGPPMTLGNAAAAHVRLVVWCKACGHRSEPDPAEQARWHGAEAPVLASRARLVCSACASPDIEHGGHRRAAIAKGLAKICT